MFTKIIKRLLKGLAALVILGVAGIAVVLGLLRFEHSRPVTLPEPTGPFAVGRVMYDWVDEARMDSLAPVVGKKRELIVWIWYPAFATPSAKPAEYLPASWRAATEQHAGVLLSKYMTRDLSRVRAHSVVDTDISPAQHAYPVVIMKSGIGAFATDYTTLAEDLASHGYIVVGSDAPYSTSVVVFPDGRLVERTPAGNPPEYLPQAERERVASQLVTVWSADVRFVLDQLERLNAANTPDQAGAGMAGTGKFRGRLDLGAVGIFGHSFGGATAAQFCHDDRRCKAGMNIDGAPFGSVIQEGLTQPFFFFLSDHGDRSDAVSRHILSNIQSVCDHDKESCLRVVLRSPRHFNFSDQSLLKDRRLGRMAGGLGPIEDRRGLAITAAYIHTFFDIHLKNAPGTLFAELSSLYPEVQREPR